METPAGVHLRIDAVMKENVIVCHVSVMAHPQPNIAVNRSEYGCRGGIDPSLVAPQGMAEVNP
jgi:hypothetical protein